MTERVIVIGAGHAGAAVVRELRTAKYTGRILVVGDETHPPYHRPPLSKGIGAAAIQYLNEAAYYEKEGVDLRLDQTVSSIDTAARTVSLRSGSALEYSHLVIATGARPRRLVVDGSDADGVIQLRTIADAEGLSNRIRSRRPLAIIGGGYVGLEVAAVARAHGLDVTILEREDRLLARVASRRMSEYLSDRHRSRGVRIITGAQVARVRRRAPRSEVEAVELMDGRSLPCATILVGIGAEPRDELARNAGIVCDRGIRVDGTNRTSADHVFAIGDVSSRPVPGGIGSTTMRLESIPSATEQAKQVAHAIAGLPVPQPEAPWFWSDQGDDRVKIAGIVSGEYETAERVSADGRWFALFHHRSGKLVAAETVNAAKEFMLARRILAGGWPLDVPAFIDPDRDLRDLVPRPGMAGQPGVR